jgi:hypothetical protein
MRRGGIRGENPNASASLQPSQAHCRTGAIKLFIVQRRFNRHASEARQASKLHFLMGYSAYSFISYLYYK